MKPTSLGGKVLLECVPDIQSSTFEQVKIARVTGQTLSHRSSIDGANNSMHDDLFKYLQQVSIYQEPRQRHNNNPPITVRPEKKNPAVVARVCNPLCVKEKDSFGDDQKCWCSTYILTCYTKKRVPKRSRWKSNIGGTQLLGASVGRREAQPKALCSSQKQIRQMHLRTKARKI